MNTVHAAFLACLSLPTPLLARGWADLESGRPPAVWWDESAYRQSNLNLAVIRDRSGRVYVGNGGVLEFDGRRWSTIDVNGAYGTRTLAIDENNLVWVGATNEVGFLDNPTGRPRRFHSLTHLVPPGVTIADVWGVHRLAGKTLFVLSDGLLVWDGTRFEHTAMPTTTRLFSFPFEDGIGISQRGVGFWKWTGTDLLPVDLGGAEKQSIAFIIPLSDGSLLLDPGARVGRLRNGVFAPENSETAQLLSDAGVVMSVPLPDGCHCVVSYTRGLIILKPDGSVARVIDRNNGLPSLNPEHVFLDATGSLWVPLDQAVVRLNATGDVSLFDAANDFERGRTLRIFATKDRVLTLSAEGVARLEPGEPAYRGGRLTPIPGLQDLFGDALALPDGSTLLSGRRRILRLTEDSVERVFTGENQMDRLHRWKDDQIIASDGLSVLLLEGRTTLSPVRTLLSELPETVSDLTVDARDFLWVTLTRKGLYTVKLDDPAVPPVRGFLPSEAFAQPPNERRCFNLDGEAYVYSDREVFHLSYDNGPRATLEMPGLGLHAAEMVAEGAAWAVAGRPGERPQLVRLSRENGALAVEPLECRDLEAAGRIWSIAHQPGTSIVWLGGSSGVIRLDVEHIQKAPPPIAPVILEATWQTEADAPMSLATAGTQVRFRPESRLHFEVRNGADILDTSQPLEVRLEGFESQWMPATSERAYQGLREGRYTFQARAVDFTGTPGPVASLSLIILPPWHRSGWAYAAYAVLAAAIVYAGVKIRLRRIARLNAELERLVNIRTEELTRAVAARSAFLTTMGHEIRNPLNGVVGLVDALRARSLPADERGMIERIGNCAGQLASAVEDVLEFSRVDAGRVPVRLRPFQVREAVDAAIDIFRAADARTEIILHSSDATLDARAVSDPDRIRQVLVNYIANAVKFGGGGRVDVGASLEDGFITFFVRDQGPGIPKDEQARLFVRFSRGTLAYKSDIPGTGLGLAACKAYAEALSGDVWLESEVGRGATFYLRVPHQPATELNSAPTFVAPDIMVGRTALVVDDHEFNRIVLSDLLGRMGTKSTCVADVPAARTAFQTSIPDVVFVDFDLPGSNGADLARWIRTEARAGRDVPIVATSAFEVDEIRRKCTDAGMDGFIAKPVTPAKVAEIMSRIEVIRAGGAGCIQTAVTPPGKNGYFYAMANGDEKERRALEARTWTDVRDEAAALFRALREGDLPAVATHAHRISPNAVLFGMRDLIFTSRKLYEAARTGDRHATNAAAKTFRRALAASLRQRRE